MTIRAGALLTVAFAPSLAQAGDPKSKGDAFNSDLPLAPASN